MQRLQIINFSKKENNKPSKLVSAGIGAAGVAGSVGLVTTPPGRKILEKYDTLLNKILGINKLDEQRPYHKKNYEDVVIKGRRLIRDEEEQLIKKNRDQLSRRLSRIDKIDNLIDNKLNNELSGSSKYEALDKKDEKVSKLRDKVRKYHSDHGFKNESYIKNKLKTFEDNITNIDDKILNKIEKKVKFIRKPLLVGAIALPTLVAGGIIYKRHKSKKK